MDEGTFTPRDRGTLLMPASLRGFVHERRRWVALIVVCFAMLMNTLDQTIVNVALPTIQHDLHFTQASLAWVIDAYLITFAGALLLAGRLGDLIGRKKVFLVGVALFTLASAACGAADSQALLDRGPIRPGARGRTVVVGHPGHHRGRLPRARGAGQGDELVHHRGRGWWVAGPPGRGLRDPGTELALDLLHQHPHRHRHLRARDRADRRERRTRDPGGTGRRRCRAEHRRD